jgi:hypothetical protein
MNNTTSILEQEYCEPERPYSQKELQNMHEQNFRSLRIGNVRAQHTQCGHFYYVKENGRKEKEIKDKNCFDTGNCSVCWKIAKTPKHLKNIARNIIDSYSKTFFTYPKFISYNEIDLEIIFYKWLYNEFI